LARPTMWGTTITSRRRSETVYGRPTRCRTTSAVS